LLWWT